MVSESAPFQPQERLCRRPLGSSDRPPWSGTHLLLDGLLEPLDGRDVEAVVVLVAEAHVVGVERGEVLADLELLRVRPQEGVLQARELAFGEAHGVGAGFDRGPSYASGILVARVGEGVQFDAG